MNGLHDLDLLTVADVAELLHCSKAHVCNAIAGRVQGVRQFQPCLWAAESWYLALTRSTVGRSLGQHYCSRRTRCHGSGWKPKCRFWAHRHARGTDVSSSAGCAALCYPDHRVSDRDPSHTTRWSRQERRKNSRRAGREKLTAWGKIMSSEIMHQILEAIEDEVNSRPSAIEFEMAYQTRVAIDRIKFAIVHVEKFGKPCDQMEEAGLQLLDALDRLDAVERRFQARSRLSRPSHNGTSEPKARILGCRVAGA